MGNLFDQRNKLLARYLAAAPKVLQSAVNR
jgi:hypothetical protein